jgi:hypothetical protein
LLSPQLSDHHQTKAECELFNHLAGAVGSSIGFADVDRICRQCNAVVMADGQTFRRLLDMIVPVLEGAQLVEHRHETCPQTISTTGDGCNHRVSGATRGESAGLSDSANHDNVRFAPGGGTDVSARVVGEHMSRTLGQQFVVENLPEAGGTTGSIRPSEHRKIKLTLAEAG